MSSIDSPSSGAAVRSGPRGPDQRHQDVQHARLAEPAERQGSEHVAKRLLVGLADVGAGIGLGARD